MTKKNHVSYRQIQLNLSQVYVIYHNVYSVTKIVETDEYIDFRVTGPHKQTAWIVLASPWKPTLITSNNTNQEFFELKYDPNSTLPNPISTTPYDYAWDYDEVNRVVFVKLLITSAVIVTVHYVYTPTPPNVIAVTLLSVAAAAFVIFYIFRRRIMPKKKTRERLSKLHRKITSPPHDQNILFNYVIGF